MTERFALPVGTYLDGAMVSASADRTAESWVFPGSRLLPTYRPSDPTKRLPSRASYSPNVFASPLSASSTTSILIKLVLPETL